MSVVIIGGNECMVCQYEKICKKHGCKAKVFVKEKSGFSKQIGNPDLMILFSNTVPELFYMKTGGGLYPLRPRNVSDEPQYPV